MADWGAWKNSSGGSDLFTLYNSCSQLSPSLYNNLCMNGSFTTSLSKLDGNMTFCNKDNIDQCASLLNQELMMFGLSSIYGEESEAVELCCLINSCHELVTLHQRTMQEREELEDRFHRTLSDLDQSQTLQSRLKSDIDHSQRQSGLFQEKERQQVAKNRTLIAKLKSEKEEVKRLQSVMSSRDLQYKHDVKKKEREINKLKERLHQVLMDKKHERQIGMSIANAVQRTDGKRSTWRTGSNKQEEEMYRCVISNYEDRQQILMLENAKLRDSLHSMQTEISSLLTEQDSPVKSSPHSESPEASLSCSDDDVSVGASESSMMSADKLSDGLYQMPYDMVQKDIEKNFHDTFRMLKDAVRHSKRKKPSVPGKKKNESNGDIKMSSTPLSNGAASQENVEELVDKLNKFKWLVKEQEELIQQSLQSQSQSVENSFLHDSQLLQDKESLAEERRRLLEAKARLEGERKQLSEAAIRLGRQRRDLEDEKARVLQQQFLQLSPFTTESNMPVLLKSSKEGSRLLPSTPTYSTCPSVLVTGSSPSDLYRAMGLAHPASHTKGTLKGKPPVSPHITKAPSSGSLSAAEASMGASPCKRNSSSGSLKISPMPSMENMSHSLDSLKKTLFNGKPKKSSSMQSLN